jgi:hypothetical protein
MSTINRFRGDTTPDAIAILDDASAPLHLLSYSTKLTIHRRLEPSATDPPVVVSIGHPYDVAGGLVEFPFDEVQADQKPGVYYYDIQLMDGYGRIKTLIKDRYVFHQDVTK